MTQDSRVLRLLFRKDIMFVDKILLKLSAGRGGNGAVAWRREKYIPKGGPTGGNGSKGGDVIFEADEGINSLDWFRNRRIIKAGNGMPGGPNLRQGKKGLDIILKVPCGTLIKDPETGETIVDFIESGQQWPACYGGRGGCGNKSYATPTNRAPNYATDGKPGESLKVELELKLIADVGLVGFPNAGKSTLMSVMTNNIVDMAPYPFTTLKPNLGFIEYDDKHRVLMADIPGIIDGASKNKGLGLEFLRHIERTKLLLYILDASGIDGRNPFDDFVVLQHEIQNYNPEMLKKPHYIVLNKIDTEESMKLIEEFYKRIRRQDRLLLISALQNQGLGALMSSIRHELDRML